MTIPSTINFIALLREKFGEKFPKCPKEEQLTGRWLAQFLDKNDDLRELRNEFCIPKMKTLPNVDKNIIKGIEDDEGIYLCGNSLGLMPKCTEQILAKQCKKWAEMGVLGHFYGDIPFMESDEHCVPGMVELVGAKSCLEVAVMNSLTVNIHLLFTAFYRPTQTRFKILLEDRAFPSDHYAIESQLALHRIDPKHGMICLKPRKNEELLQTEDILRLLDEEGQSIAIVFFSGIQYYTGQHFEIERITRFAQQKGCLVGWDLAHAFANVPLKLHDWNVDFACWCTYKYGCSGAGGPGAVFIHERIFKDSAADQNHLLGWWSHKMETRFEMTNELDLDLGAAGFRISNPSFLQCAGMLGSLEVFKKVTMQQLREKSILLTGYLEFLVDKQLSPKPARVDYCRTVCCEIITPRNPNLRGCQLSLKFNCDIRAIYDELVRRGVVVDKRFPSVIRVAPVHLYNSFDDVWRFVNVLLASIQSVDEDRMEKQK